MLGTWDSKQCLVLRDGARLVDLFLLFRITYVSDNVDVFYRTSYNSLRSDAVQRIKGKRLFEDGF